MVDTPKQARGRDRLDRIVLDAIADPGVDQGRMFSTVGWRSGGKVFAFVGRAGDLMVKLPEERVRELVRAGIGQPMTIRERTMREWVHIPADREWDGLVVEAHAFLAAP